MIPRIATRIAPRIALRQPILARPAAVRYYASSASDGPDSNLPPLPAGFEKLFHSPTALSAVQNLVELMKKNGVDITSGQRPSMFQLMKLATNGEIKEATGKVMEELKQAGVDVSPAKLQELMNNSEFFKGDGKK